MLLISTAVIVGLTQEVYLARESDGSVGICVNLSGTLEREVAVWLSTVDNIDQRSNLSRNALATPAEDYLSLSTILTFTDEEVMCCNISLLEDLVIEDSESFTVSIVSNDTALVTAVNEAEVSLLDSTSKFIEIL